MPPGAWPLDNSLDALLLPWKERLHLAGSKRARDTANKDGDQDAPAEGAGQPGGRGAAPGDLDPWAPSSRAQEGGASSKANHGHVSMLSIDFPLGDRSEGA